MQQILERPAPPPTRENQPSVPAPPPIPPKNLPPASDNPAENVARLENLAAPRPEIYQGNVNKMDVLNLGEQGHDRAVPFQLKQGTQKDTFVLGMDAKNPGRVINVDTRESLDQMTKEDYARTAILRRQGNELLVTTPYDEQEGIRLTQEQIRQNPHLVQLTDTTGVEILDFDPQKNSILIHKAKRDLPPIPLVDPIPVPDQIPVPEPAPQIPINRLREYQQKLITIIAAPIATVAMMGGHPAEVQPIPPPAIVETIPAPQNLEVPQVEPQLDPSLRCEKTQSYQIKPNDFLTKALVDVNGINRYQNTDGSMDVNKLYRDLMCLLAIPDNQAALQSSDPAVANFVKDMMQSQDLFGPATSDKLLQGLQTVNSPNGQERYKNASKQLAIVQPGQLFYIPFHEKAPTTPPGENPISTAPAPVK